MDGQKENTVLYFLAVSAMPSGPKETYTLSRDEWVWNCEGKYDLSYPFLFQILNWKNNLIMGPLLYNNPEKKLRPSREQAYIDIIYLLAMLLLSTEDKQLCFKHG